ncbi:MAG: Holliday junction ATP-dependent DNA helicase RuvA [Candidatus Pacebacteria bacterium]|nr:Holliday junction ATP-dependent DNA helicase RuvA [Candidatus Paceibacterota bacterium]MDD4074313.1 Holliday junction ATP-dependent DNA helicase RuvA [Candidatus Paceibacterota bacterium]
MISYINGKIIYINDKTITIERSGIGFDVFLNSRDINKISLGQEIEIFTELVLKEKEIELYGFLSMEKLKLFKTLKNISGIGPKSAIDLSFVSSLEELKDLIEKGEIKGIGEKKLQKILLEITGKVKSIKGKINDDAVEGLISLGFKKNKAIEALKSVPNEIEDTEQRIKEALKLL